MEPGLYMVATPIGNLEDLSPRARSILAAADVIACEDTRHSARLLAAFGIGRKRLVAVHEHNEIETSALLVREAAAQGHTIAYVSDAGTPGVSDPGAVLCAEAHRQGMKVYSVSGPSALASCLSVCGFKSPFVLFSGFLPRRRAEKKGLIERAVRVAPCVFVFYESPRRIQQTVEDIQSFLSGAVRMCISRELSKVFESNRVTTVGEARACLLDEQLRGEFTVALELQGVHDVLSPNPSELGAENLTVQAAAAKALEMVAVGQSLRSAAQELTRSSPGLKSRDVYQAALQLGNLQREKGEGHEE
jgi:16S rRNA (cytidine1402-2'-O)-methyltransferase